MYVKIVVISFLILCLQHLARILYMSGYHVVVYNHTPGPCRLIPGVEHGSEDIETLPNGMAFISSGLMMSVMSDYAKKYYDDHNVQGRILLFDYNHPEKDVVELKFSSGFDRQNFMPHGISLYQNPDSGKIFLFVVNHAPGMDRIEKFEFHEDTQTLEHLHSYVDEAIHLVNDVAATSENSFYFTYYGYFRDHFRHMMEIYFLLPFGSVWYYDGKDYTMVADGIVLPNGITVSKDHKNVYVSNCILSMLNVYTREENNTLTLEQEYQLYSMPDNINIETETGNLIIAIDPAPHMMAQHLNDPEVPAASKVVMVTMKNGSFAESMTELFSDDGSGEIWGLSVADVFKNKMLLGTVHHKLMYCEVRTL